MTLHLSRPFHFRKNNQTLPKPSDTVLRKESKDTYNESNFLLWPTTKTIAYNLERESKNRERRRRNLAIVLHYFNIFVVILELEALNKNQEAARKLICNCNMKTNLSEILVAGDIEGEEAFGLLLRVRFYIYWERVSDVIGARFRRASKGEPLIRGSWGDPSPISAIPATKGQPQVAAR